MDTAKAIKTSQFSFDNLIFNTDISRTKPGSRGPSQNNHPAPPEKPRLLPLTAQIKVSGTSVQEKLRPWKNASPLPGLYNEKKALHPNMRPPGKKLPFKITPSSPLTTGVGVPTPQSGQMPNRQSDLFLPRQKEFRVRTGSSLAKVQTDNSSMRSTSRRHHRDTSLQRELSANSMDNSDFNLEKIRNSELARASLLPVSHHRETLPLLVIHFEGIIGTCLVQVKEECKDVNMSRNKEEIEPLPFFIKKGVRADLKVLSKMFLIIVILPSLEQKYKKVTKHFITNKFSIDGIYHIAKEPKSHELRKIEDYTLNYNLLLEDFRSRVIERKIVILLPMHLNPRTARSEFALEDPIDRLMRPRDRQRSYDDKQFLYFFPKIKSNLNNLRIICIPNFTMNEKYDRPSMLLKSTFTGIYKMIEHVYQEMMAPVIVGHASDLHNSAEKHMNSLHLLSISLYNIDTKEGDQADTGSCRDADEETQKTIEEQPESKTQRANTSGIYTMDLEDLLGKIEDVLERNRKWRKIKQIKLEKSGVPEPEVPFEFDLGPMKQEIIEGLIEGMRNRGIPKGNIMHHFLVGDLFSRNNYMFKFYEKNEYFSKKAKETINGIVRMLRTGAKVEGVNRRDRMIMAFESAPMKANSAAVEMASKGTEDENEAINMLLIKRQAKIMQLYLGD